ncbi:cupin domain-containing protein [Conexibacter stalactiti]|uniref:Cupin domain-containing protein n=1 Tax=Conexibacter stalactiti TaxID=1940611 RepID=A0ABU4HS02_9ACTN|nr:cupin domain-containing protein [Conexibacter stalactiti]MDW5596102.1 cupin domain-containing protein [Conexibacter stalactiti]MEC5036744.1 cupin domain-containing protein [Conexibacter stalactiti]
MSGGAADAGGSADVDPAVWWLDGVRSRIALHGDVTGGRVAVLEEVAPRGTCSPLHSHPEDETWQLLEGSATFWIGAEAAPRRCGPGDAVFAAGGTPHALRVESERARMVVISTPAGLERWVEQLGTRAPDDPPPPRERISAVARALGVVVHGRPPEG